MLEFINREYELYIVGLNEDDNLILFGEVKWSAKKVGVDILTHLRRKSALLEWGKDNCKEFFVLFSRNGFTEELKQIAANEGILLRSLKDVVSLSRPKGAG